MDMLTLLLLAVMPALVIVAGLRDLTTMIIPNWISGALIVGFFPAAFAAGLDLTTVGVHLGVALAALAAVKAIVAGRLFGMPHASKVGIISVVIVFVAAIAYLTLPGMLATLLGAGCI